MGKRDKKAEGHRAGRGGDPQASGWRSSDFGATRTFGPVGDGEPDQRAGGHAVRGFSAGKAGVILAVLIVLIAAAVVLYAKLSGGGEGSPPELGPEGTNSAAPARPASPPVAIRIPSIKLDSSKLAGGTFMPLGLASDGTMEVPDVHQPAKFGFYCPEGLPKCGAPLPGQTGPSVIASHVNGDGKKGGFYALAKVTGSASKVQFNVHVGDLVDIDLANGTTDHFKVSKTLAAPKDDFPTQEVWGAVDHPALRLITCGGQLDQKAHSYLSNVIVFADLVP